MVDECIYIDVNIYAIGHIEDVHGLMVTDRSYIALKGSKCPAMIE